MFLFTLQRPYNLPGFAPIILLCCSLRAPDDFKYFKYTLFHFSWFAVKFSKPFLVSTFSN